MILAVPVLAALLLPPAPPPASPFITMRGGPRSVSCVGDVDGDGTPDFAAGWFGRVYMVSGKEGGLIWELAGAENDAYGASVAGFVDADGDGVTDLLIGCAAPLEARSKVTEQERLADFGELVRGGSVHLVSGKDGTRIRRWNGKEEGELFGYDIRRAGDVNADGIDDWIVGAPGRHEGRGGADVLSGKDGELIWRFEGSAPAVSLGTSVSGAGDVDGDGHADLVVGSPGRNVARPDVKGGAWIYSGKTGELIRRIDPIGCGTEDEPGGCRFGISVSDAGDLDRDGYADVLVGADSASESRGNAWVFAGSDGSVLFELGPGRPFFTSFGSSVTGLGDVNEDGVIDLAVSDANNTAAYETVGQAPGGVFVFSGADGSLLWSTVGEKIHDLLGYSIERCQDIDGDSVQDLLAVSSDDVWILSGKDGSKLVDFDWPRHPDGRAPSESPGTTGKKDG